EGCTGCDMTSGFGFYATTLLVYAGVSIIACWGLDLQYGSTGIPNFAFIIFQAIGAYVAALVTLGSPHQSGIISYQRYLFGAQLPYPMPLLIATFAGAVLSVPVGQILLKRLREDYLAIAMLVVSLIATIVAEADVGLVNGTIGVFNVPEPFANTTPTTRGGSTLGSSPFAWWCARRSSGES